MYNAAHSSLVSLKGGFIVVYLTHEALLLTRHRRPAKVDSSRQTLLKLP